jgi:TfoX/Sxy family transcriptional regulator of competence genes
VAFDERLAARIDALIGERDGISSRRMFGGIAWMLDGNMACGVVREDLMLRLGPDGASAALTELGVRPMDFTGRPMRGYVFADAEATASDAALATWVERSLAFAAALPPKHATD